MLTRAATVVQVLQDFEAPPTIAPRPPTTVANPHIDRSLGSKETHVQSHNRSWRIIIGEWSDDRRSGQGHYFYANGDEYIGEWQNHLRHGQGRYMYASSGLQYEGQWRDGKRTGDGEISRIGG